MIDSIKLVTISIAGMGIFSALFFLLRKKRFFCISIVILASLLPLLSLLRPGVYQSGDFAINLEKSIDLYHSLTFGIFPVHWASLLNANYGYPLYIFTYPLPYYSIALFHFVGFSFILSEKMVMALAFIASGVTAYYLAKEFLKPLASSLVAILYLFAPYHLVDLHFRTDLGEIFAFLTLPLTILFLIKFVRKKSKKNFIFSSIAFSFLIFSHQAIALISTPFLLILPLFFKKDKQLIYVYFSFITGILLTAFYWLPLIYDIQYTNQSQFTKIVGFENPLLFIFSPWRFGFLYQGPIGQISFPIGFVQITILIYSLYLLISQKLTKKIKQALILLWLVFLLLFFMLLPISKSVWQIVPLINNFQFTYRLMLPISLIISFIGGIVLNQIKKDLIIYMVIFLAMGTTILNWGNRAMIKDITDSYLIAHVPFSTFEGEGLQPASPKWRNVSNLWIKNPPKQPLDIVSGIASVTPIKRTPTVHTYIISAKTDISAQENTLYFPGWNLYVDGTRTKMDYQKPTMPGVINFLLTRGNHNVKLLFKDTKIIKISNTISLIALFILTIVGILSVISYSKVFHKHR